MLTQLIIIQIITFAGLIVALRMLFYRHLNTALKRLHALHEEGLIKEAQLKEELERAKLERLGEVEKGKQEAKALVESAKKDTEVLKDKSEGEAKALAGKIIQDGKQELERLKAHLLTQSQDEALNLSMEIIKHTFADEGREDLQHQLIEELMPEIEHIDKEKLSVRTNQVKVTSSFALTDKQREHLKKILCQKIGMDIEMQEHIDPGLITGLVIEVGALVIDGSLKNKLKKVAAYYLKNRKGV